MRNISALLPKEIAKALKSGMVSKVQVRSMMVELIILDGKIPLPPDHPLNTVH